MHGYGQPSAMKPPDDQALDSSDHPDVGGSSFYEALIENVSAGVYFVDRRRVIIHWNKGAERLSGYAANEVAGKSCGAAVLQHEDENGRCLCAEGCPLKDTLRDGTPREVEVYLRHKLGHRVPVIVRASAIRDSRGEIVGAVEVFNDASAKKRLERRAGELEDFAYRDCVTGVANRRYAELRLDQVVQDAQVLGRHTGLILLDLDNFKHVNDTLGHPTGDRVLAGIGKTLARCLRRSDVIGRWGGEEFLVLLLDSKTDSLEGIAERCRIRIASAGIASPGEALQVTASMGVTLVSPSDSTESVIVRADRLLYESKRAGKNRVSFGLM